MKTKVTIAGKWMLSIGMIMMLLCARGNCMVSPVVHFERTSKQCAKGDWSEELMIAYGAEVADASGEQQAYFQWEQQEDGTYRVTLYVQDTFKGFDYGIAFSPKEVTVVEYGFVDAFKDHYKNQQGSTIDHHFAEGERVSPDVQYIVYGGMATKEAAYEGPLCYVTVSLKGDQATIYGVKDSATYDHGKDLMTSEVFCKIVNSATSDGANDSGEDSKEDEYTGSDSKGDSSKTETATGSSSSGNNSETETATGSDSKGDSSNGNNSKTESATKSTSQNGQSNTSQTGKTGDERPVLAYVIGCLVSAMVVAVLWQLGRKQILPKK